MNSLFSRFRKAALVSAATVTASSSNTGQPNPVTRMVSGRTLLNSAPSLNDVVSNMLLLLEPYLPAPTSPLTDTSVFSVSVNQRSLGVGNWRGTELRGTAMEVALKGGRIEGVVRFQVWGESAHDVDVAIENIHLAIIADANALWAQGFIKITAIETSPAEMFSGPTAWRKTTDYKVLYEYHYRDSDGAESLIASIPIHADPEQRDSPDRETSIVTDELVRWDDREAVTLEIVPLASHSLHVSGLASFSYMPLGWNGEQVTVTRLRRDAVVLPTTYPTWAEFLTAVTRAVNPDQHAQVTFATLTDFLAAFTPTGDPVALGDWDEDGVPDQYQPANLIFNPSLKLDSKNDVLQLSYQSPQFDSKAVIYIRTGIRRF